VKKCICWCLSIIKLKNARWNIEITNNLFGAWGGVVVKALRYKSEGTGIDSRWCHWIFQWHIPSDRTMVLGSTQPLVKMTTRNIPGGVKEAGAWGWRPHHLHVPNVMKIWAPKTPGNFWATLGLLRDSFTRTNNLFTVNNTACCLFCGRVAGHISFPTLRSHT